MKVVLITTIIIYLLYTQIRRDVTKTASFIKRNNVETKKEFYKRIKHRYAKQTSYNNQRWMTLLFICCGDVERNPGPPSKKGNTKLLISLIYLFGKLISMTIYSSILKKFIAYLYFLLF